MKEISAEELVLGFIKTGEAITPLMALNQFGCFRLASIIHRLRKKHEIQTETVNNKSKIFAQYRYVRAL